MTLFSLYMETEEWKEELINICEYTKKRLSRLITSFYNTFLYYFFVSTSQVEIPKGKYAGQVPINAVNNGIIPR